MAETPLTAQDLQQFEDPGTSIYSPQVLVMARLQILNFLQLRPDITRWRCVCGCYNQIVHTSTYIETQNCRRCVNTIEASMLRKVEIRDLRDKPQDPPLTRPRKIDLEG